ncbi:hypothetical protein NDU88_006755 [Pleurodeles waltl]|uniref:Uncharacterized protein n=1 Tax=Pleurodeles waltl TaxID=8319 RepID=A0AAV7MN85_PLEWA|nr:hypothetical protein NDU88_006755 [Pleurodeles waltl]
MGKYATARIYREGERPGAVLVNLACPNREKDTIMVVQAEDGSEITDPEHIANRFCAYYEALYTSKIAPNLEAVLDYLLHIEVPWLTAADIESLMAPLSLEELPRCSLSSPHGSSACERRGVLKGRAAVFTALRGAPHLTVAPDAAALGGCRWRVVAPKKGIVPVSEGRDAPPRFLPSIWCGVFVDRRYSRRLTPTDGRGLPLPIRARRRLGAALLRWINSILGSGVGRLRRHS